MPRRPRFKVVEAYKGRVFSLVRGKIISFSPKDAMLSIQTKKSREGFMGFWGRK